MHNSLKELRERAVIEITNKIVNNMTMSEVMEVVIKYSEQTATKAVEGLDRKRLKQIIGEELTIDKNIKRTPIEKRAEWAHEPMSPPPKKEDGWLSLFNRNKKKHPGWNKKKEEATILTRIKKFFKFK